MNVLKDFQTGANRYAEQDGFTYGDNPEYKINQRFLATILGLIAVLLPTILAIAASVSDLCFYRSISHFYYARFWGDVVVAAFAIIGTFLIAYRGQSRSENRLATGAGLAAFGLALFPASGSGCLMSEFKGRMFADMQFDQGALASIGLPDSLLAPFDMMPWSGVLHYLFAAILFGFLAWYSFFVFTRLSTDYRKKHGETLTREKRIRNRIYIASGSTILVSAGMLLAQWGFPTVFEPGPANWLLSHWTFIFECIALFAFGSAWLTKGRFADRMLLDESEEKELRQRGAS